MWMCSVWSLNRESRARACEDSSADAVDVWIDALTLADSLLLRSGVSTHTNYFISRKVAALGRDKIVIAWQEKHLTSGRRSCRLMSKA